MVAVGHVVRNRYEKTVDTAILKHIKILTLTRRILARHSNKHPIAERLHRLLHRSDEFHRKGCCDFRHYYPYNLVGLGTEVYCRHVTAITHLQRLGTDAFNSGWTDVAHIPGQRTRHTRLGYAESVCNVFYCNVSHQISDLNSDKSPSTGTSTINISVQI